MCFGQIKKMKFCNKKQANKINKSIKCWLNIKERKMLKKDKNIWTKNEKWFDIIDLKFLIWKIFIAFLNLLSSSIN